MAIEIQKFQQAFFDARSRAATRAQEEKMNVAKGSTAWDIYNSPMAEYDEYFRGVMGQSLGAFLETRRLRKGKVFYMDVMGTGRFYDQVAAQTALTLVDFRTPQERVQDDSQKMFVVGDDLLRNTPWLYAQSVISHYDDTAMPGYDLITCRPIGGWMVIRGNRIVNSPEVNLLEKIIVQRSVNLLSPQGGTLALQMAMNADYSEWVGNLKKTPGISVNGSRNIPYLMSITKETSDHVTLPDITGVIRPKLGAYPQRRRTT